MFEAQLSKLVIQAQKNAPQLLFTGDIMTGIASTVAACRATLKVQDVITEAEKSKAHIAEGVRINKESEGAIQYSSQDRNRDTLVLYIQTAVKFGKLYGPAVVLGVASVAMLTKSHRILNERNAGLAAALTATTTAFEEYRRRIVDEYGEEKDRELRHGKVLVEESVIDKNGKDTGRTKQVPKAAGVSMYARLFDRDNNNWTHASPETNLFFLRCQQNWLNDRLQARGHVFLNEVYDSLGMERTPAGAVVGWIRGEGDNEIDFGVWRDSNMEGTYNFMTGLDDSILLDFNVQGTIWDRI